MIILPSLSNGAAGTAVLIAALALGTTVSDVALAQSTRPSDCASRLAALDQYVPGTSTNDLGTALSRLFPCTPESEWGRASLMRRWRFSQDSMSQYMVYSVPVHVDTATIQAAYDVAADAAASELARSHAFAALIRAFMPGWLVPLPVLRGASGGSSCYAAGAVAEDQPPPVPVPTSLKAQIVQLATGVSADGAVSTGLRSAAYCTLDAWRGKNGFPRPQFGEHAAQHASLLAICKGIFAVRNSGPITLTIAYDAPGVHGPTEVSVPPKPVDAPHGEIRLRLANPPQVRVLVDGQVVTTANASMEPCPTPTPP